jgi:hypothetical protein
MGDNLSVFLSFNALSKYHKTHKKYPKNWNVKDADEFLKILEASIKDSGLS